MAPDTIEPQLVDSLRDAAREIFETMVFLTPSSIEPRQTNSTFFDADVVGLLSFTGTASGTVAVTASNKLARLMAAKMLMMEPEELTEDAEVADAFGEIVNMLTGSFKNAWVANGNQMELSVPNVVMAGSVSINSQPNGSGVRVMVEGEPVDVGVHFDA
ncbi:MAG TPA: chemotaxis protein CheX [bacterium]|nr:chemotaxis protein CheX [bacterium]